MESIKKIIREEIDSFGWVDGIPSMKPEIKWLNDNFKDLERVINGDKTIYYNKKGEWVFYYYQDRENGHVWFSYLGLFKIFEKEFSLKYREIQELLEEWLELTYNLKGLTPLGGFNL